jgi:uncharacterized protein YukE
MIIAIVVVGVVAVIAGIVGYRMMLATIKRVEVAARATADAVERMSDTLDKIQTSWCK